MCSAKERRQINNFNRGTIGLVATTATFLDGVHPGDLLFIASTAVWLMQVECRVVEEKLLDRYKAYRGCGNT